MTTGGKIILALLSAAAIGGVIIVIRNSSSSSAATTTPVAGGPFPAATNTTTANNSSNLAAEIAAINNADAGFGTSTTNSNTTNSTYPWADANNYPEATQMLITAATTNTSTQNTLQQKLNGMLQSAFNTEVAFQNPSMGALYFAAVDNLFAEGYNYYSCKNSNVNIQAMFNGSIQQMTGFLSDPSHFNCTPATINLIKAFFATRDTAQVAAANQQGIYATTLAQNLINAYNAIVTQSFNASENNDVNSVLGAYVQPVLSNPNTVTSRIQSQ